MVCFGPGSSSSSSGGGGEVNGWGLRAVGAGIIALGRGQTNVNKRFCFSQFRARIEQHLLYYTGTTVNFRRTKIVVETAVQRSSTVYSQHCLDACLVYAVYRGAVQCYRGAPMSPWRSSIPETKPVLRK